MTSLAGSFLVAVPSLRDPNFHRTVVLLLQHGAEGALGLVVNRPAQVEGLPFPIFAGGPCPSPGLFLLHGHREWLEAPPDSPEGQVAPGIFLGDASCVARVSEPGAGASLRFRVFTGYAGWGPGQLDGEVEAEDWIVTDFAATDAFTDEPDALWKTVLGRKGGAYALLATMPPDPSVN